jgi:phosphopantetheine--protein transferase-like protein
MTIKSGIDLVYIPRFKRSLENGGENFLRRVFSKDELENPKIEHLAGIFAAKEAAIKALSLPPGAWHDIQVSYRKNGSPQIRLLASLPLHALSLSISHENEYAIAQFVALADD